MKFRAEILVALVLLAACDQRLDMHDQEKYEPYEASPLFADGRASRQPVDGTVARGHMFEDEHLHKGMQEGKLASVYPFPIGKPELLRGQERYNIYCMPCHAMTGDGMGMVVRRGFPRPPTMHQERLRTALPGYIFQVITNGIGTMPGYAPQIPARDRWLIAAYLRALQMSRNVKLDSLTAEERAKLEELK